MRPKRYVLIAVAVVSLVVAGVALGDAADAVKPLMAGSSDAYSAGTMDPWTGGYYYTMDIYLINNAGDVLDSVEWEESDSNLYFGSETGCSGAILRSLVDTYGWDCECYYEDTSDRQYDCEY